MNTKQFLYINLICVALAITTLVFSILWYQEKYGGNEPPPSAEREAVDTLETLKDIQKRHEATILAIPGVVGMGIGLCGNTPCFEILLLDDSVKTPVPSDIEGVMTRTVVTGEIKAHEAR